MTRNSAFDAATPSMFKVNYNPSNGSAAITFVLQRARLESANIFDQQGRRVMGLRVRVTGRGVPENGPAAKGLYLIKYRTGGITKIQKEIGR